MLNEMTSGKCFNICHIFGIQKPIIYIFLPYLHKKTRKNILGNFEGFLLGHFSKHIPLISEEYTAWVYSYLIIHHV